MKRDPGSTIGVSFERSKLSASSSSRSRVKPSVLPAKIVMVIKLSGKSPRINALPGPNANVADMPRDV